MAVDVTRATNNAIAGIINDPDNEAPGRAVIPTNGDELRAMVYYIVKAVLQELTDEAELNSAATGVSGVID